MRAKILLARVFGILAFAAPLFVHAGPKIENWTLPNGARVYFVQARELPMVQVRALFDAGSARDPKDKGGLATLTNLMLREGATGLTADDIASRFEGLGAEFGPGSERDMATLGLRSLTDRSLLDPALDLFTKILASPTFPEDSLERERQRLLVGLAHEAQSPGSVAQKTLMRAMYGEHPYGAHSIGDEASLKRITRADLVEFFKRYYVARNLKLVVVGDLSARDARRISEKLVGGLAAGDPAPPLPAVQSTAVYPRIERVSFPATQSHILMGEPSIARGDPDYFPLYVGNYVLGGGGLVSRLSTEVREKRGLAYSAYSYFSPMRVPGPFVMGLETKNASRDESLNLMHATLKEFSAHGPTESELEAAKKNITGGFPLRIDSNRKIAEHLGVIAFFDLPLTYLDDFPAQVQAVTIEQIRAAFARRVREDKMITVIVGGES